MLLKNIEARLLPKLQWNRKAASQAREAAFQVLNVWRVSYNERNMQPDRSLRRKCVIIMRHIPDRMTPDPIPSEETCPVLLSCVWYLFERAAKQVPFEMFIKTDNKMIKFLSPEFESLRRLGCWLIPCIGIEEACPGVIIDTRCPGGGDATTSCLESILKVR